MKYRFERNRAGGLDCYRRLTVGEAKGFGSGNGSYLENGDFVPLHEDAEMMNKMEVLVAHIRDRTLVIMEPVPKTIIDKFPQEEYDRIDMPVPQRLTTKQKGPKNTALKLVTVRLGL